MSDKRLDQSVVDVLRELDEPGQPSILVELGTLFLSNVPERISKMRDALGKGDFDSVRKEAHSLKSASGNLGAMQLSAMCKAVEQKLIPEADYAGAIDRLYAEFEALRPEIEVWTKS